MKKEVKLMPDYNCQSLWDMKEGMEIDISSVHLSSKTLERLRKWAEAYNQTLNVEDPISSGFKSESDEKVFEDEGMSLWQKIKDELGQGYKVFYFSQLKSKLIG